MSPQRIQRKRTKGWRMPEGAVYVGRPSKWGNPAHWYARPTFNPATGQTTPTDHAAARRISVQAFLEHRRMYRYPSDEEIRKHLAGRDLACWCPLDHACHADVLLEIANSEPSP